MDKKQSDLESLLKVLFNSFTLSMEDATIPEVGGRPAYPRITPAPPDDGLKSLKLSGDELFLN
jgi:hypothetical protein